jgi:flagellar FliL protein
MADSDDIKLVPIKHKKSKLTLILMVLLLLTMGAAGFFGWQYMSGDAKPAASAEGTEHAEEGEASEESESAAEESGHGGGGEGERGAAVSTVLNFEPFLVNLADREASRYLRVTIRLQVTSKSAAEKIATADALTSQMRDTILGTLSAKNSEQIVTREGKDELKNEIAEKLNAFLPGKPIKAVYFTDFVVQL